MESCIAQSTRIVLLEPVEYPDFLYSTRSANLIVSDSGDIREEAARVSVRHY